MPGPPKPPKGPADLHEVERALSVLQGRHPEHERARREDADARKRRAIEIDGAALEEARRVRRRRAKIVGVVTPVVLLFAFIGIFGRREMARRARIDAVSESFRSAGFTVIDTSLRGATGLAEANAEPGCMLAVSTNDKEMSITHGGITLNGAPPVLFCTCVAETIAISAPVGGQGGVALLRADTATIGGSRAFGFATVKPASTLAVDSACADTSLDAWIEAKHYPPPSPDETWLTGAPTRAALATAGFHVAASVKGAAPFIVLEVPKDSCVVASSAVADERLGIRLKGEPIATVDGRGTIGRCAQAEGVLVISREGAGDLTVLVAPAARLGGELGLRELMTSAGLAPAALVVPSADRAWDAKQLLVASAVPEGLIDSASAPDVATLPEGRVAALSLESEGALFPELAAGGSSSCIPALDQKPHEAICVFSGEQKWKSPRAPGDGVALVGGLARAKLPFWLYTMKGVADPVALEAMAKLFAIARTLGRQGFVPTTLEALVEQPTGVQVLGRTGEDAVVAVGVAPSDPFVYPLADDQPWTLDEPPQIAMVKPLEKVTLVTSLKKLPPIGTRRTVVFRRHRR